jgi:hypothetical protein
MLDKFHIIIGIVYRRYHGSSSTAAAIETTSPTIALLSRPTPKVRFTMSSQLKDCLTSCGFPMTEIAVNAYHERAFMLGAWI